MPNLQKIEINIARQNLGFWCSDQLQREYAVSTANNGPGERFGSECTPRGRFKIRAKIGAGCEANTVFVGRRVTGELYSPSSRQQFPDRDWILTRILWLSGLEPGFNRFGDVDTMKRYIYIHGCPDEDLMGVPSSHGCIKMRNSDVVELFDLVLVGALVQIKED